MKNGASKLHVHLSVYIQESCSASSCTVRKCFNFSHQKDFHLITVEGLQNLIVTSLLCNDLNQDQ